MGQKNSSFNQEKALKEPGVIGLASTLVQAEKQYEGLIRYLLGKVVVVDQIDHAIALARKFQYTLRIPAIFRDGAGRSRSWKNDVRGVWMKYTGSRRS